nr:hypothetical protein [Mycoplasmopsis bovis]
MWPFIRGCIHTIWQRWEIEKCLTLQKYFGTIKNKSSFRNESLHNRVYKLLVTNNSTKVKNNLIRLNFIKTTHSDRL